jgi:hypothetical protein
VPTEFDLDKLRISAPTIARRSQTLRPRIPDRFIKGPIPLAWITAAAMLPGRCLHVGVAIWYLAGLGRREVVELRPSALRLFGVSRYAGYRALLRLEQAGLVDVERNRGRSAIVTIVFPTANTQPSPP